MVLILPRKKIPALHSALARPRVWHQAAKIWPAQDGDGWLTTIVWRECCGTLTSYSTVQPDSPVPPEKRPVHQNFLFSNPYK